MNQPEKEPGVLQVVEDKRGFFFPLNEIIYLRAKIRSFLLESICLRLDVQDFVQLALKIKLEKHNSEELRGNCPHCFGVKSFRLNKRSGQSHCQACGVDKDLFDLINQYSKNPSNVINDAVVYLQAYVELMAEQAAAREADRQARRKEAH